MPKSRRKDLEDAIASWDGRIARDIAAIYDDHGEEPGFVTDLITLCRKASLQSGATWLLKRHQEVEGLAPRHAPRIYDLVSCLETWPARLHLLQLMPHLAIPASKKDAVAAFIEEGLTAREKVARAWAFGGLYELVRQYPEYEAEAMPRLEAALRDEAPSVKARIRNAMKEPL